MPGRCRPRPRMPRSHVRLCRCPQLRLPRCRKGAIQPRCHRRHKPSRRRAPIPSEFLRPPQEPYPPYRVTTLQLHLPCAGTIPGSPSGRDNGLGHSPGTASRNKCWPARCTSVPSSGGPRWRHGSGCTSLPNLARCWPATAPNAANDNWLASHHRYRPKPRRRPRSRIFHMFRQMLMSRHRTRLLSRRDLLPNLPSRFRMRMTVLRRCLPPPLLRRHHIRCRRCWRHSGRPRSIIHQLRPFLHLFRCLPGCRSCQRFHGLLRDQLCHPRRRPRHLRHRRLRCRSRLHLCHQHPRNLRFRGRHPIQGLRLPLDQSLPRHRKVTALTNYSWIFRIRRSTLDEPLRSSQTNRRCLHANVGHPAGPWPCRPRPSRLSGLTTRLCFRTPMLPPRRRGPPFRSRER